MRTCIEDEDDGKSKRKISKKSVIKKKIFSNTKQL